MVCLFATLCACTNDADDMYGMDGNVRSGEAEERIDLSATEVALDYFGRTVVVDAEGSEWWISGIELDGKMAYEPTQDEIDKLAKKKNATQRDVSGESVQQGMLRLLEGSEVEVPVGATNKNAMVPMTTIDTSNILFICGGAFPGLEDIIKERLNEHASIGFRADLKDKYDGEENILKHVTTEDVRKFGMIPEFIGRLPILFSLDALSEDMLVRILKEPKNAIIKQYQKLLAMDEVELEFTDDALLAIAKKAKEKDVGARALRSIIEEFMLDIMYEIPKDDNIGKVTITKEYIERTGGPLIQMRGYVSLEDHQQADSAYS